MSVNNQDYSKSVITGGLKEVKDITKGLGGTFDLKGILEGQSQMESGGWVHDPTQMESGSVQSRDPTQRGGISAFLNRAANIVIASRLIALFSPIASARAELSLLENKLENMVIQDKKFEARLTRLQDKLESLSAKIDPNDPRKEGVVSLKTRASWLRSQHTDKPETHQMEELK